jgi:SAM-dependent methyltransferase
MEHETTSGYAEKASALIKQYESVRFADVHGPVVHLIPAVPCRVLDIGSGTGRDAAALAAMGHHVVAVEPIAAFRTRAASLHPSSHIEWVDDSLPNLMCLTERAECFDVIMLTAVWMHLDQQQRQHAMLRVTSLLRRGGVLILSLRHGPVPAGRRMFDVSAEETIDLARAEGLNVALQLEHQADIFGRTDVTWTLLGFTKGGG